MKSVADTQDEALAQYLDKCIELSQVSKDLLTIIKLYTKKIEHADTLSEAKEWAGRLLVHGAKI